MITTVVGSFPIEAQKPQTISDKFKKAFGLYDSYKKAIEEIVELQFELGIDIITEGQVRGDMVGLFVKHIPGFTYKNNSSFITSKIKKPSKEITVKDVKIAQKKLNELINESNLSKEEIENKGVKGIITGPSTIIYSSHIESFYKNKDKAIIDYAHAIKHEAKALEKTGCKYIQIDEPFLSTGIVNLETAQKAINIITKDIKIPTAMHVCGDISKVFKNLAKFNVDILDFEFAGNNSNIRTLEDNREYLNGKKIGFGCINSASRKLDNEEEVEKLIKRGIDIMGSQDLILDPDCGLKKIPLPMVKDKLNIMIKLNRKL